MVRGRAVGAEARETIYNVYLYFVEEANRFKRAENGYFQKVQERVCQATGVSRKFISRLLDEKDKLGSAPFTTPSKKRKISTVNDTRLENNHSELTLQNNPPPLIYSIVPLNVKEELTDSDQIPPETLTVSLVLDNNDAEPIIKRHKPNKFPYITFESDSD